MLFCPDGAVFSHPGTGTANGSQTLGQPAPMGTNESGSWVQGPILVLESFVTAGYGCVKFNRLPQAGVNGTSNTLVTVGQRYNTGTLAPFWIASSKSRRMSRDSSSSKISYPKCPFVNQLLTTRFHPYHVERTLISLMSADNDPCSCQTPLCEGLYRRKSRSQEGRMRRDRSSARNQSPSRISC